MLAKFAILAGIAVSATVADASAIASDKTVAPNGRLVAVWNVSGQGKVLKTWSPGDLQHLKQAQSREKDPLTGRLVSWHGALFSQFIEKSIEELPADQKAQVDLVILKSATGRSVAIPRFLITKYPVLLSATQGGYLGDTYALVMPWTSKSRILSEGFPVEQFAVAGFSGVEFASFREHYSGLFLKRRTDPSAIRGEKIFINNCTGCHSPADRAGPSSGQQLVLNGSSVLEVAQETRTRKLASLGHPEVKGGHHLPKLGDRDRRALASYLHAYRMENEAPAQPQNQPQPAQQAQQNQSRAQAYN